MPEFSVMIVNYNSGDCLERCIDALIAQTYQDFEVIIVDNASQDDSLRRINEERMVQLKGVVTIRNIINRGFAAANNQAAEVASADWIITLNPDAFPQTDWLAQLFAARARFPEVVMFGSTQYRAGVEGVLDGCGDWYHILGVPARGGYGHPVVHLPETGEIFGPCAAAAMYRKDVFLGVDGFDEQFFCYGEDVDLAFRLRLLGHRCIQIKEAAVHHIGSASSDQISMFAVYYGVRNRWWIFLKNMPTALLLPLLPFHLLVQGMFLARAIVSGKGKAALKAWWGALRGLPQILAKRTQVQKTRHVPILALARTFTWSLKKFLNRAPDVRPLSTGS